MPETLRIIILMKEQNNMTNPPRNSLLDSKAAVPFLALFCCALWGSAFPCIKLGYAWLQISDTGSQILFAGYRFFLAGILTFLLGSVLERKVCAPRWKSVPMIFGQGILQTTIQYVFFYIGLSHTTGAKASIINASNAFFAIIIAHFLLQNEKITWRKCIGCFVGFAGVIVMNLVPGALGDGFSWNGEGFVLLCSIAYGASSVTLKKIGHLETSTTITAFQLLFGGAVLILIGWICGGQIHGFAIRAIVLLIYMAALSAVAFSIWTALLQHHLVGKIAIYGFSIPVFGVVLSGLLLGETMVNLFNLLALVLVSVGIIVVNRTPGKQTAN